ncbi:NADP-dependent oxidoreductase [Variovorax paradoxus]|nr:NADP-dependent oxidoreductase [Variovorax paradoxus]MBT2302061.1 NADP-dependent oxidoreductase [Variovorax paradoxus]
MTTLNHQFRLARRPVGLPQRSDFDYAATPLQAPAEGKVQVQVAYVSIDPAMRGWVSDSEDLYDVPMAIGDVMRAVAVGRVTASAHPRFAVGDSVAGILGVEEYTIVPGDNLRKIDPALAPLPAFLNALGMPGITAYFGLLEAGQPQAGETVVVSGAAGAVGSLVGQIAKIKGARVIGIAGGADKCRMLTEELGFDAAIDYKREDVAAALRQHAPKGVDVFFDNVGGAVLDAVLLRLAVGARIVICGAISQYNNVGAMTGPANYLQLVVKRATMRGILVRDFAPRALEAATVMGGWLASGQLKAREDVVVGLEHFPETFQRLFDGSHNGKLMLQVAP